MSRQYRWVVTLRNNAGPTPALEHLHERTVEMLTADPPPEVGQSFAMPWRLGDQGGVATFTVTETEWRLDRGPSHFGTEWGWYQRVIAESNPPPRTKSP